MKNSSALSKRSVRVRIRAAVLVLLAVLAAPPAAADLFSPNRLLHTIRTRWFDITFPENVRPQAEQLAALADDAYREVAAFLGTEPRLRFPVVLSPDTDGPNGYYSVWPRRRIVLFPAPTDPNNELGYQADYLRALFLHELAHAVSLTIRSPFWDVLAALFGDAAGVSFYTTPASMAEGASIAAEGLSGRGRAADPRTADELIQDAREGRFKSFWEAAGAWDRYPYGRVPYSYGALFTRYLLDTYGEDSYRELWRRMGEGLILPGLGDFLFIRGVFRRVYGLPLSEAWADFEAGMTPSEPSAEPDRLSEPGILTALAAEGRTVWWSDAAARRIRGVNVRTGRIESSLPGDGSITRISLSIDGRRLLISHSIEEGAAARLAFRVVDTETDESEVLSWRGFRDWFGADILAIRSELGAPDLVLLRDEGVEVLAPGGPALTWASPCASPDGRWLYALRREEGDVAVVRFPAAKPDPADADGSAGPAGLERLVLPENWKAVRDLSVDEEGTLRFSFHDGRAYRTAELREMVLRYPSEIYAGGARKAVSAAGRVFFLGE